MDWCLTGDEGFFGTGFIDGCCMGLLAGGEGRGAVMMFVIHSNILRASKQSK